MEKEITSGDFRRSPALTESPDIVNDAWYEERKRNKHKDAERIIVTAAKLIMAEIQEKEYTSVYPKTDEIRNPSGMPLPKLLKTFLEVLIKPDLKQQSIGQSNWQNHLGSTAQMLNLFAATGHINYAKSARLLFADDGKSPFDIS